MQKNPTVKQEKITKIKAVWFSWLEFLKIYFTICFIYKIPTKNVEKRDAMQQIETMADKLAMFKSDRFWLMLNLPEDQFDFWMDFDTTGHIIKPTY